jgi:hypothetical protein
MSFLFHCLRSSGQFLFTAARIPIVSHSTVLSFGFHEISGRLISWEEFLEKILIKIFPFFFFSINHTRKILFSNFWALSCAYVGCIYDYGAIFMLDFMFPVHLSHCEFRLNLIREKIKLVDERVNEWVKHHRGCDIWLKVSKKLIPL